MDSALQHLLGREVISLLADEELHLTFDEGTSLSIFNRRSWSGGAGREIDPLPGARCLEVIASALAVSFRFDNGATLTVDLSASACSGPEAMVLRIPGRPIVVWN